MGKTTYNDGKFTIWKTLTLQLWKKSRLMVSNWKLYSFLIQLYFFPFLSLYLFPLPKLTFASFHTMYTCICWTIDREYFGNRDRFVWKADQKRGFNHRCRSVAMGLQSRRYCVYHHISHCLLRYINTYGCFCSRNNGPAGLPATACSRRVRSSVHNKSKPLLKTKIGNLPRNGRVTSTKLLLNW